MAVDRIPLRKNETDTRGGIPLAEFQPGEVVPIEYGGTGASALALFSAASAGFVPSSTVSTSAVMLVGSGWIATSSIVPRIVSGDVYTWDSTRSKWLGNREEIFFHTSSILVAGYLNIGHVLTTSTIGWPIPDNATIIGIAFARDETTKDEGTVEIRQNGIEVTSLAFGTAQTAMDMTLNTNISASDVLSAYWSGSSLANCIVRVFYKKRL